MKSKHIIPDPILLILALVLSFLGLFFSFDAGYGRSLGSGHGLIPHEFFTQFIALVVGIALAGWILFFDPRILQKVAKPAWYGCVILLLLTSFSPLRAVKSGGARWIHLGPVLIQGAEFAKVGAILYLSYVLSHMKPMPKIRKKIPDIFTWLDKVAVPFVRRGWPFVLILFSSLLIEKEPDLGTAAVIISIAFVMSFVAGVNSKVLLGVLGLLVLAAVIMVKSEPYRLERLMDHGSQWNAQSIDGPGFQQLQAKVSMAYGGIKGKGIGEGRAKLVIPAPTTDFVLATVAEETGFLGTFVIFGLLAAMIARLIQLGRLSTTPFVSLFLFGVASWLAIQGSVNALQANDTLPSIGIPFPFISSGGSSLVALWIALGLCEACLRQVPETLPKEAVVDDSIHGRRNRGTYIPSH